MHWYMMKAQSCLMILTQYTRIHTCLLLSSPPSPAALPSHHPGHIHIAAPQAAQASPSRSEVTDGGSTTKRLGIERLHLEDQPAEAAVMSVPPPSAHTSALTSGRFFMLIHAWLDVWAQVIVYTITRRPNKTRSHWLQKDIDCGWRNTAGGAPPHLSCLFISKDPLRRWWAQMCGNDPGVHVIWRRFAAAASSYGGFY